MEEIKKKKTKSVPALLVGIALTLIFIVKYKNFMTEELYLLPIITTVISIGIILLFAFIRFQPKGILQTGLRQFFFVLAPLIFLIVVEFLNDNYLWEINYPVNVLLNYLLYLLFLLPVHCLVGNTRRSIRVMSVVFLIFGIVNHYVTKFKGSPFLPWDITAIRTAVAVSGNYTFSIDYHIITACALTAALWFLVSVLDDQKKRYTTLQRSVNGVFFLLFLYFFYGTQFVAEEWNASPDFFNQNRGYKNNGSFAEFMLNTRYLSLSKPKGYDPETLSIEGYDPDDSICEYTLHETAKEKPKTPNIIVIMNEAFSDLSVIGDFETDEEVMPYINSLRNEENVIEGNLYVSTIGTGTSNTEYEFLCGNSEAFLPFGSNTYQLYIDHEIPSLVSTLKDQGYYCEAMHPYYKEDWNRPAVYEYMGFERFLAMEDMPGCTKLRHYVSDLWDFRKVIDLYEKRDRSKPYFMFNITMQNHSAYDYEHYENTVSITSPEGEYPDTEQYLSLIRQTDTDFKTIIDYFKRQKEDTIILMFGDHQPFIENAFYEDVMGEKISEMDDETQQKRYISRFILWANYDIPEGWIDAISANYLSSLLLENTGLEAPAYNDYLESLYKKIPVISQLGCKDNEGNYFRQTEQNDYEDLMRTYNHFNYNCIRETKKRRNEVFYIKKDE